MCRDGWFPWQRDMRCLEEQQGDRRSIDTVLGSPGFRTDPLRQPNPLRFAHRVHHRSSASFGQGDPAVVETRLRSMMAEQHVRQSED